MATSGAPALPVEPAGGAPPLPRSAPGIDLETALVGEPRFAPAPLPPLETVPYSDRIRGRIAERLIWMLAAVILLALPHFLARHPSRRPRRAPGLPGHPLRPPSSPSSPPPWATTSAGRQRRTS